MFKKNKDEKTLVYDFAEELSPEIAESLAADVKLEIAATPALEAVVFNTDNQEVSYKGFKTLCQIGLSHKKPKFQIYILSKLKTTLSLVRKEGMDNILKPISSIAEVSSKVQKQVSKLDVTFVNPFIEGAVKTLSIQCQVTVTIDKPVLKTNSLKLPQIDILGIIGITSKAFSGNIVICFPQKVFLFIMSQMLGETYTEITKDLEDGAGEILNMIFGHAKTVLNENGHSFERAIPAIMRAPNISVTHLNERDAIILPFKCDGGDFYMEISMGRETLKP
jgi:chemotaxis protein CheX